MSRAELQFSPLEYLYPYKVSNTIQVLNSGSGKGHVIQLPCHMCGLTKPRKMYPTLLIWCIYRIIIIIFYMKLFYRAGSIGAPRPPLTLTMFSAMRCCWCHSLFVVSCPNTFGSGFDVLHFFTGGSCLLLLDLWATLALLW
jgi:hypothetical protein